MTLRFWFHALPVVSLLTLALVALAVQVAHGAEPPCDDPASFYDPTSGPYDATAGVVRFCAPEQTSDGTPIDADVFALDRCDLETPAGGVLSTRPSPAMGALHELSAPPTFLDTYDAVVSCYLTRVDGEPLPEEVRGSTALTTFRVPRADLGAPALLPPQ